MDKKDLKVGEKYMWRHQNDTFETVEEEVELVSLEGGSVPEMQEYGPGDPMPGPRRDPESVKVKVLSTGSNRQARACDLKPLSEDILDNNEQMNVEGDAKDGSETS